MSKENGNRKYVTVSRDFKEIREQLDIEIVLQHYGYTLSSSTGNNKFYRIYKPSVPGSAQRIVVMNKADQLFKGFVDLSDTTHKGDSIQFIYTQEQEDWKRTFYVIDSLLGNAQYAYWKSQLPALIPASASLYLDNEKIIQTELIKQYQVKVVTTAKQCDYLVKKRQLALEHILSDQFLGCILQVSTPNLKSQQRHYTNIAFPLTTPKGNMVSMDIRGDGYKAFPEGSKGEGIWLSNPLIELTQEVTITGKYGDNKYLSSRKKLYFSKIGIRFDDEFFKLPDNHIHYLPPSQILFAESPIDALSFHQLYPPQVDEYRLYVSACGNPSKEQQKHLAQILAKNPFATIYLAYDADAAGVRYAINTIGIDSIVTNSMAMHYVEYVNEVGEKAYHNRLTINASNTHADMFVAIKSVFSRKKGIVLLEDHSLQLIYSIENDLDILRWVLQQLVDCVNKNLGRERFLNYLPIGKEKDYNAILKKVLQGTKN